MQWGEVMIVDDSSTSRMIIQRCIEMAGIEVGSFCFAENGLEAISLLRDRGGVDVIVTDVNMPKMDGRTFIRSVKTDPETQGIPVIIVSSIAGEDMDSGFLSQGAAAVVKKPVSPAKMAVAFGGLR